VEQEESLIKDSWIYNVPKHIVHKPILIDKMRLIPQNRIDQISHTDYNLPAGMIVEWREYFLKNIYHQFKLDFEDKVKSTIGLHNAWFQWYEKNDYHVWHIHGGVHFTNIYYLSLPNKEVKTTVKNRQKQIRLKGNGQQDKKETQPVKPLKNITEPEIKNPSKTNSA